MRCMMSLSARRELLASTASRYQAGSKREKSVILNEFVASTEYDRKYAITILLRSVVPVVTDRAPRHRSCKYDAAVKHALVDLWKLSDGQCGKLLAASMPVLLDSLKAFGEELPCPAIEQKLRLISPATIDRLLKKARRDGAQGISTTRSGPFLRQQIAVRT